MSENYFDSFDIDRGAQSLLKALRMHKAGDVAGARAEITWVTEKYMSVDVFLMRLFEMVGDKELAKLIPALHALTGKKFHSRLINRLVVNRKYISTQTLLEHIDYAGIKGQMMVMVIEEVGVEGYFEILNGFKEQGTNILPMNSVLYAGKLVRLKDEEVRDFVIENLKQGYDFGVVREGQEEGAEDTPVPLITIAEMQSDDWQEKLYLTPPAQGRRDLMGLVWRYLEQGGEELRGEVYRYFASLSKDRYENSLDLIIPVMGKDQESKELLLDLMDIYLESYERISFSEGFGFCIAAVGILADKDLNDYIDDLVDVVEEQREERENILDAVNRHTVPAIFNRYIFKSSEEVIFAYKIFERLAYTSLPAAFFMRYVKVFVPHFITSEVQTLADEIERDFGGLSRMSVLRSLAESKPAAQWMAKAQEFEDNGNPLLSREWSTGIDSAIRTRNRELFDFAIAGYKSAADNEAEYYLFHSARYLLVWGEPVEWPKVIETFKEMRVAKAVASNEYLPAWMVVWMVRNAAERWMPTVEDFIEKFMYQPGAIDSKVLSALCEKYRVEKKTEEIRRVIGRFGSRVKGEADWALLVLARAYYEVRLPDMAFAQLEEIASGPVPQEVKRRAYSYGVRFNDPRVFELFDLSS